MTDNQNAATPAKKQKRALPIRVEIVLPLGAMIFGIWFYFATMFDGHMRWLLQKGLTMANGAEANVASFHTSFKNASLSIRGIQMTDETTPTQNWLQIGEIRYALDWNGLLRAKFVVDDASIVGIGMNVQRKTPGFVVPKKPEPKDEGAKDNAVLMAAENYFKETAAGTFFDDLATLKSGADLKNKLNELKAELSAEKKVQELQRLSAAYQAGWEQTQTQIKNDPELKTIETSVNALKTLKVKTPQDVAAAGKDAENLKKLVEKKVAEIQAIGNQAKEQVRTIDQGVNAIPQLVKDDVKFLQGQLQLPDIKVEDLSSAIFGKDVMASVHKALFYYHKGKNLYATVKSKAPKEEEKEEIPVHERRKGINYEFPVLNRTFPRFYVKRSELSVYEEGQTTTESVRGLLTNLSSSPSLVAEPIKLAFSGNMSSKGITGIAGEAVFDHRFDDFKESFALTVAQIPVTEHLLTQSKEATIALKKANMALQAKGHITAADMAFENLVNLKNTEFATEASGKDLQRILGGVFSGISGTQVKMAFGGPWNGLKMDVSSDLGKILQKALRAQFDQEVARMRAQVEEFVQARIQVEREKLDKEVEKAKAQVAEFEKKYTDMLKGYEAEANQRIEGAKAQLQGQVDEAKAKAEREARAKAEEEKAKAEREAKAKAEEELKKKAKGIKLPGFK